MNKGLTEQGYSTRQRIYDFIVAYIEDYGYPPTIREIADGIYVKSTSTVHSQLVRMMADGVLETDAVVGSSRAIRVPGYRFVKIEEGKHGGDEKCCCTNAANGRKRC